MTHTLERVVFKAAAGIDDAAMIAGAEQTNDWLKEQPGFLYRTLVKDADGTWSDLVFWASPEAAQAADAKFGPDPKNAAYCACIDMASTKMTHLPQLTSAMGGA